MDRVLEAVYESGVLKPLESLDLADHQRVVITVHPPPVGSPETELAAWQQIYTGLSERDVEEIESIALDRNHFMN